MADINEQLYCRAPEGLEQIEQRLIKLEMLLVNGLSQDISTHLDIYIRRIRKMRSVVLPANLFSDAAWDILLELKHAKRVGAEMSASDLGELLSIPQNMIFRYLKVLEAECLIIIKDDVLIDHRVTVELTRKGSTAMDELFDSFISTVNKDLEKARLARLVDLAA